MSPDVAGDVAGDIRFAAGNHLEAPGVGLERSDMFGVLFG